MKIPECRSNAFIIGFPMVLIHSTPITINLDKEAGQPVRFPLHLVPKLQ